MGLYRINQSEIEELPYTTFAELGIHERYDLQRLLTKNISAIAPNCLVLTQEFGGFENSRRRIDLLALDRSANLVVIELKRDEDGGHMELQALRYAAMASTMTFQDAVDIYDRSLRTEGQEVDAKGSILSFLGWSDPDEDSFAQDVRIVLATADFSKELTSTVLWLNERDLDIQCVRIRPYRIGNEVLVDIQPVVPLPEAADYQFKVRNKVRKERLDGESYRDFTRYDLSVGKKHFARLSKRELVFRVVQYAVAKGATPDDVAATMPQHKRNLLWRWADGTLSSEEFIAAVAGTFRREGKSFDARRFFRADDELFHIDDKTFALTNQWGGQEVIDAVEAIITRYGDHDISYRPSSDSVGNSY